MSPDSFWPVPFVISPNDLAVDTVVTFCVSVLIAITINAEAQAFMSNFLGDRRTDPKDRFHFIPLLHLDILGSICYVVGGFGWPKFMDIDTSNFEYPRLYMVLSRLAGPLANILMASIVGSAVMIFNKVEFNPRVFLMVMSVNLTTAIYNLIPIPPMAMGYLVLELAPQTAERLRNLALQIGPFAVLALALLERITHQGIFSPYFDPIIRAIYHYLAAG